MNKHTSVRQTFYLIYQKVLRIPFIFLLNHVERKIYLFVIIISDFVSIERFYVVKYCVTYSNLTEADDI